MISPRAFRSRNPGLPLFVGGVLVAMMAVGFLVREAIPAVPLAIVLAGTAALLLWSAGRVRAQWNVMLEREQWLHTMVRSIGDAVIATDGAGRITFMNPVAQTLTGWEEGEARGQPLPKVFQILDRKTREPLGNSALRILRDAGACASSRATLLVGRDGVERPISESGAPIRQADGETIGLVIVFRDASAEAERRAAEEQVRREMEFSDKLINSMPGIFYLYDARRKVLRWNHNFETVTGRTAAEIAQLDPIEFFTLECQQRARARMRTCLELGKADVEVRFRTASGPSAPYYITGLRIEIEGQPCVLGIGIDISDRERAEAALHATMRRLERQNAVLAEYGRNAALLEADLDAALRQITEMAARTLDTGRASVWFYDEARSMLRCADLFEEDGARHSSGFELKAAEFPAYFRALEEERAMAADDACNDPRTAEFADLYLRPLGLGAMLDAPIRSRGKTVGVICHEHRGGPREWAPDERSFAGSMADLVSLSLEAAQRRQAEAELRQAHASLEVKVAERTRELAAANEQLKELDRLKSEFLATMSHELRTPLNSIIGFTGILRQGLPGPVNPEQSKQLGMVYNSATHLLGLINDLLDLSRIESGRMEVHPEKFQLAAVVEEVAQSLRPQVQAKGLTLETQLDDPAFALETDRKKTFQILLNLANNAVKFTGKGRVHIDVKTTPAAAAVVVSDTGIGIKPEHMGRLFEAFRQVDGSARRVYEGTGLGLYLCRKLATMLGGTIGAESEFGVGSRFTFTLPRRFPTA
jgi:PAS domain S-box-containing protein